MRINHSSATAFVKASFLPHLKEIITSPAVVIWVYFWKMIFPNSPDYSYIHCATFLLVHVTILLSSAI